MQVQNLSGVKAIATGSGSTFSLALKNDGTVWAWGSNFYGGLGDGTSGTHRNTPVQIKNLSEVTAIDAGSYHSLALKTEGTVMAWGYNHFGQLGDGTTTNRLTPVQVRNSPKGGNLSGITAITAGSGHSLALKADGTVRAWGSGASGILGDGATTNRNIPVKVSNLTGVKTIASGSFHSLALKTDGTVRAWGRNEFRQLGDGTTTDRSTPVQVQNLSGIKAISTGLGHSLATVENQPVVQK